MLGEEAGGVSSLRLAGQKTFARALQRSPPSASLFLATALLLRLPALRLAALCASAPAAIDVAAVEATPSCLGGLHAAAGVALLPFFGGSFGAHLSSSCGRLPRGLSQLRHRSEEMETGVASLHQLQRQVSSDIGCPCSWPVALVMGTPEAPRCASTASGWEIFSLKYGQKIP